MSKPPHIYTHEDEDKGRGVSLYPWVYYHGDLANIIGYDLVFEVPGTLEHALDSGDGIIDVLVVFAGSQYRCKAYIWRSNGRRRGLIVLEGDEEDMDFARKAYDERRDLL